MGEARELLESTPRDPVYQAQAPKKEVMMVTGSPDRPPGDGGTTQTHFHSHSHSIAEPPDASNPPEHLTGASCLSEEKNNREERNRRRSRWDPAPSEADASSRRMGATCHSTTTTSNGFGEHAKWENDLRNRRYSASDKRSLTPRESYHDHHHGSTEDKGSGLYDRVVYERGVHRLGSSASSSSSSRNGFEQRKVEWSARKAPPPEAGAGGSGRREWSTREGYDPREGYGRETFESRDKREWSRNSDRDRRRADESGVHRGNEWQGGEAPACPATPPVQPAGLVPEGFTPEGVPSTADDQGQRQGQGQGEVQGADEPCEGGESKPTRGWQFIDEKGELHGPVELSTLKLLASNGQMQEDHLVSRAGTNAWVTLEHAQSPDAGSVHYMKLTRPAVPARQVRAAPVPPETPAQPKYDAENVSRLDVDGRVERLMRRYTTEPGDGVRSVLNALDALRPGSSTSAGRLQSFCDPWRDTLYEQLGFGVDSDLEALGANPPKPPPVEERAQPPSKVEAPLTSDGTAAAAAAPTLKWIPGKWISKGGDWKLMHPEGHNYVKVVLNEGCSLLLSGTKQHGTDPRRQFQFPDVKKAFELPQWAVERSQKVDANPVKSKPAPSKAIAKTPAAKASDKSKEAEKAALPVAKPPPQKSKMERPLISAAPVKVPRPPPHFADIKSKAPQDLGKGDWFYKDGGGRERGPYAFSELQSMVSRDLLTRGTSVFRKSDDLWVPLPGPELDSNFHVTEITTSFDCARRVRKVITTSIQQTLMGFTCGQLYEHVMRHYKNQVMSAILFEGVDARLKLIESTKKLSEVDILSTEDTSIGLQGRSHPSPSSSNDNSDDVYGVYYHRKRPFRAFKTNGNHEQSSKKCRVLAADDSDSSDDEVPKEKPSRRPRLVYSDDFNSDEELDSTIHEKDGALRPSAMMRICHHLKGDLKALVRLSATSKAWQTAVVSFKPKLKCLDLSSIGAKCTDAVLLSIQQEHSGRHLKQLSLRNCTKVSAEGLRKFLVRFPSVLDVDIGGCDQFVWLMQKFPQVNWLYDEDSEGSDTVTQGSDEFSRKSKSLKSFATSSIKYEEDVDDESEPMEIDQCYSNEQDLDFLTQQSGYKRVKLNDTKPLKENGYSKGKRTCERKTKKLSKLKQTVKLEEDTASTDDREWGARMTKAAMVPPVTRKYEVIEEYSIVIDRELVERKMRVELPDDYEEKLRASKQKRGGEFSHLDIPELKEYHPRRELGVEVIEQEVYGIDPYTHNLLLDTMPAQPALSQAERLQFMEEDFLQALNQEVKHFTGTGKAPLEYELEPVLERLIDIATNANDLRMQQFSQGLYNNMRIRNKDKYVAYRKGLGVVCNKRGGFEEEDFVVEFLGEVYPAWRWYEKQDGCRFLQKKDKDPAPEFYNIMLERPKGDAAGYDVIVVDAMHKANFASRICHSCRPNCEAKVAAVNNRYIIGVYALRPIKDGEELTFDYNSVTESKEEYLNSICLCGSQCCRGSYLNLVNAGTSQHVMKEHHGLLDRHALLLEACCDGPLTRVELEEMKQAGVGSCLLEGLPDWLLKYAARLIEFMNLERRKLPDELLRSNKKRKKDEYMLEWTIVEAENHAEGVFNQRLQNLAITIDKVRYVLRQLFTDPREAPPLLKTLDQKELVARLWSAENSVVNELLNCMIPHMPPEKLAELKRQVRDRTPDERTSLRESLLWLRDNLRTLESTVLSRHDAASDLIHMYAYTQCFFTCEEYGTFESPPIEITSLDLGRHVTNSAPHIWKKTYNKEYVLGQLISWYKQTAADPGASLVQARRGCLVLPDVSSCYAKGLQQDSRRAYGTKLREEMFPRIERWPQKQWPKSQFWEFKSNRGLFGSPMLDAVHRRGQPDVEMMHWLKTRPVNFVGPYDD